MYKPTRTQRLLVLMLCLLTGIASTGFVQNVLAQSQEEINIRADYMQFDLDTGNSIYQGNVSIIQGGIKLTGEEVIVRRDKTNSNEIRSIEVSGNPAHYLQDENTDNKVNATSQNMKYNARKNRLVMTVNARLEQSDHTVESERIVYDTSKKVILAGKQGEATTDSGRVNITLTPKKSDPQDTPRQGDSP